MIRLCAEEYVSMYVDQPRSNVHAFRIYHLPGAGGINGFGYPGNLSVVDGNIHQLIDVVFWVDDMTAFDNDLVGLRYNAGSDKEKGKNK